ncbi:MAG TPA: hypothetical protein VGI87_00200 [Solirubrobacteraceae bacterium]
MHPEITRAMVQAQQINWNRPSAALAAQLRSDAADASARPTARRLPFAGGLRAALRLKPLA